MNFQTSIKKNFIMNVILTASSLIFPLITFPYVSRILLPEGTGRVAFVLSIISYFSMVASLGIPTYGIRACAQVRDDQAEPDCTGDLYYQRLHDRSRLYRLFSLYSNGRASPPGKGPVFLMRVYIVLQLDWNGVVVQGTRTVSVYHSPVSYF